MQFSEIIYSDARPVDGYGSGFFRVGGEVFEGPIIVTPTGVLPWGGVEDHGPLCGLVDEIDVLFIGTGDEIAYPPKALKEAVEATGLGLEPMSSPSACRTFNVLVSEGRRVAIALLPVS
ncbi:Mth938-like domain-containing protein [Cochlodiniinecator piscidefendens]|uniref:Mth938-like domain-containing protein n=1 Tax=Cochlodiniinecator piscidefendens TaxID=2715756 RepID=UPI001409AFA3|nr:Mth938-like domain-containing protein [Cochlodiniinecator piscidefendens]